jgi:protein-disulfide isomerase
MNENRKINPYLIIIAVLIIVIVVFAYNQWGKRIFPASVKEPEKQSSNTEVSKDDIWIGNENAPVTIVEYYSYLCGYCKEFEKDTKPKIVENYVSAGKVKFVLRPFPIFSPDLKIDEAVLCANEQGKFLDFHNYLFENNDKLEKVEDLKNFAKNVGLNETQFNQCFDSDKFRDRVDAWYKQGVADFEKANIPSEQRGTPTFVINGELTIGALPYDKFVEIIEKKLGK